MRGGVSEPLAMVKTKTRSTCCYCGVGCGVVIESDGERIISVTGDPDHPANHGKLCTKGSTLALTMTPGAMTGRARFPEMRLDKSGERSRATWDATLDHLVERLASDVSVLQAQLKEHLGIQLEIRPVETKIYYSEQSRLNYDLCRSSWLGDYNDPTTFLDAFRPGNGNNRTGWASPRYESLLEEAERASTTARRIGEFEAELFRVLADMEPQSDERREGAGGQCLFDAGGGHER